MENTDAKEIMRQLQEPFPPEDIEWRVGATAPDKTSGIALAYVTNRAIMSRLDAIFGPFGWRNEFREWKGSSQLCGISILWEGEWITKWDGADDSNEEAVKGGLSDAMKRAGYQWGIGRYLYNLENQWVPIKQRGRSYALVEEPRLPEWALPTGYKYSAPSHRNVQPVTQPTSQTPKAPPASPPAGEKLSTVASRVYKLRADMGWEWQDLNEFASDILGREIKFLKRDITDINDWKKIEETMLTAQKAS
ncbi:Rad52/Rad22 family DNA repair protein [Paenibacillus chitinolyticus]|uniref:Rad52/Rad22 family DNA repair protein n=1 Tax=Paenibacillus chitinolyticus TaxID=79263 RepID=UPI003661F431